MQMLGIENVVELSYAPKRRNVSAQEEFIIRYPAFRFSTISGWVFWLTLVDIRYQGNLWNAAPGGKTFVVEQIALKVIPARDGLRQSNFANADISNV